MVEQFENVLAHPSMLETSRSSRSLNLHKALPDMVFNLTSRNDHPVNSYAVGHNLDDIQENVHC
jgi:hypothetical protein